MLLRLSRRPLAAAAIVALAVVGAWGAGGPLGAVLLGLIGGSTATLTAPRRTLRVLDLDRRELAVVAPLIALILVLGVYPEPLLNLIEPAVAATMSDLGGSD